MKKGDVTPVEVRVEQLKRRSEQRHESIVAKCHPAIFEIAPIWKESMLALNALGAKPPKEIVAEIETRFDLKVDEVEKKYSGSAPPPPNTFATQVIFSDEALRSESDDLGIVEFVHFERHRTPLKIDSKKRSSRDYDASRRVLRTLEDLEALRCDRKIKAFKGEPEHRGMFQTMWGFGLERLTPEELVIFFDEYCPCCEAHDPEALKKFRNRFQQLLQRAIQ